MSNIEDLKNEIAKVKAELKKSQDHLETLRSQVLAEHPHYCTHCSGHGGHVYFYGGSYWEPGGSDFEPCPHCVGEGKHPLVTTKTVSEEEIYKWCEKVSEVMGGHREHSEISTLLLEFFNQEEIVRSVEDHLANMQECLTFEEDRVLAKEYYQ